MFSWKFENITQITQCRRLCALVLLLVMLVLLPTKSEANVRLCGAKLTATLKFVCKSQVCSESVVQKQKRAYINDEGEISYLRHLPKSSNDAIQRFSRSAYPGIVKACCSRKCSLDYLKNYCCLNRPPPTTTTTQASIVEGEEYEDAEIE